MANFEIDVTQEVLETALRKIETGDPVHADVYNALFQVLINNDAFLDRLANRMIQQTMIAHVLDSVNPNMVLGADQGPVIMEQIRELNSDLDYSSRADITSKSEALQLMWDKLFPKGIYIYNNGNEYKDLTAGWVAAFYGGGDTTYTRLATAKTDSYLHIYDQDRGYNRYLTVWQTATSIDLTYFTKITITCELVLSARLPGHAHVQVLLSPIISTGGSTWPTGTIVVGTYAKPADGNVTMEFTLPEVTGEYQIMIEGRSYNYSGNGPSNCNCKIKQVQLRN